MALINRLANIGNALRNKSGKSEKFTLDQMINEINALKGASELTTIYRSSNPTPSNDLGKDGDIYLYVE